MYCVVAVGLCTELKLTTERLSKEFVALTADKTQIQSSIESVDSLLFSSVTRTCRQSLINVLTLVLTVSMARRPTGSCCLADVVVHLLSHLRASQTHWRTRACAQESRPVVDKHFAQGWAN